MYYIYVILPYKREKATRSAATQTHSFASRPSLLAPIPLVLSFLALSSFLGPYLIFIATFSLKLTSFHYSSCQFAQMVADNFEGTEYALPYGASPTPIGKTDRYSIFKVRLDVPCPAPVYSRNPIFWPTSAGHC